MTAILNEEPTGISQIVPGTPPALLRIVHRCLDKNPKRRFQSAADLAFALEALSDSSSSSVAALDQGSRSRWMWILATAAVVALAAALIAWWWRIPPAVPVVESVTQLTDDGEPKGVGRYNGRLVSDGSRIYFNEGQTGSWKVAQVSVSGGRTALVDTRLVSPWIVGLAADGSALLALLGFEGPTKSLWSIPLPAGEPQRLGNAEVQHAALFPDGRILFQNGTDLYAAAKDGSNPRKLGSVAGDFGHLSISPDGKQIVFPVSNRGHADSLGSLVEFDTDGRGPKTILNAGQNEALGAIVGWSSDGRYLVFYIRQRNGSDLGALPVQTGIFHRSRNPIRLTNGPLFYSNPCLSRDGKQIFAVGTRRRGELVRYDTQSRQFLPFLSGISATEPNFSADGKWVAYTSYPDHTLWRSRSDGTDRMQLTYPPMEVSLPFISPDGTKVAFRTPGREIYVVKMDGGLPQRIEKDSNVASWSPTGTSWS